MYYILPLDTIVLLLLEIYTSLISIKFFLFVSVASHLTAIKAAVSTCGDQLTPREHAYIRAVLAYASGSLSKASEEFCNMLIDYPLGIIHKYLTFLLWPI